MTAVQTGARLLTARWVLPMSTPPIENGGIEIDNGRVVAVYTAEQFGQRLAQKKTHETVEEFKNAIVVPGFINLHTHLDWTAGQLVDTHSSLIDWIPSLVNSAKHWSVEDFLRSASAGAHRIASSGTTCVFDSSFTGQAAVALTARGLRGVVALELFGVDDSQLEENWNNWLKKREQFLENARISDRIKIAVAPHAPYSVSPLLMRRAFDWAGKQGFPLTTHISESSNEFNWFMNADEKLDVFLQHVHALPGGKVENLSFRGCGKTPVQHMGDERLLGETLVAAHAVQLTDSDIQTLAHAKVKIAHCPRSNARLRTGVAPVRKLKEAGVAVGFGTDSAASTDNLDVLSEARFAWNLHRAVEPQFPFNSEEAIRALTVDAAKMIGMSDLIGTLEPGKQADIAIFNIVADGPWAEKRPYDALLYGNVVLEELLVSGRKVALDALY
jgi:cytosine/adenosine deaminase-related metal-dependent hydrolase